MKSNFNNCLHKVLAHEGGFINHEKDTGGMTNLGITKTAWEEYAGRESSEDEMRAIDKSSAEKFYKKMYWDKMQGDKLPAGIDYCIFDASVNSGVSKASKWAQQCVGANIDGIIGVKTLNKLIYCWPSQTINVFCNIRLIFLKSLNNWETFGKGWERRVKEVNAHSLCMTL